MTPSATATGGPARVGYVGLGAMGGAMARRLSLSRPLRVFDLDPAAVDRCVRAGALGADTPAALARDCDVVMICVPRSENVRAALFAEGGLLAGLARDTFVIDQTSGDPAETRAMGDELARSGIRMLDAPVSGGTAGADAGTIAIMVGGADEDVEAVGPVLRDISPNVTHCGALGAGQVVKLINNTISTCNRLAMLEGVAMGIRNGIDPAVLQAVLNAGGARSRATETYLPVLTGGAARADFALSLMLKDLNLAAGLAMKSGVPLSFGLLARAALQGASNVLGPGARIDDLAEFVAAQASIAGFRAAQE